MIVWDEAALSRLLDRSALEAQRNFGESSAQEPAANDNDLFSAFKVCNALQLKYIRRIVKAC